jgi:hypothetical protein
LAGPQGLCSWMKRAIEAAGGPATPDNRTGRSVKANKRSSSKSTPPTSSGASTGRSCFDLKTRLRSKTKALASFSRRIRLPKGSRSGFIWILWAPRKGQGRLTLGRPCLVSGASTHWRALFSVAGRSTNGARLEILSTFLLSASNFGSLCHGRPSLTRTGCRHSLPKAASRSPWLFKL